MNRRACVVEVVEQVPDADVAIVAARVGERLAMSPERVRKLIDGRIGPITRALRADKADAIAQTFESAGVRVVIRPAEFDELDEAQPATWGESAAASQVVGAEPVAPEAPDAQVAPEARDVPDARVAPYPDPASADDGFDDGGAEPLRPDPRPDAEAESGAGREGDPAAQSESPSANDRDDAAAADPGVESRAVGTAGADDARAPEFEGRPEGGDVRGTEVPVDVEAAPENDDAPDADGASDLDDEPDAGDEPVPDAGPVAHAEAVVGALADRGGRGDPDRVGDLDGGDDPVAGDVAEPRGAHGGGVAPERGSGVGRGADGGSGRRFAVSTEWVEADVGVWSTSRPSGAETGAVEWDVEESGDEGVRTAPAVPEVGRSSRRARPVAPASGAPTAGSPTAGSPAGGAPTAGAPTSAAPTSVAPTSVAPASVAPVPPIAWRGLGTEPRGAARPADAPVPRRQALEAPIVLPDARRRRRSVLLVLLAVSVVGFLLSQWWVASRANAASDATGGFRAYRDGDFAAARSYWGVQAQAGDPAAQFMLGYLAEAGLGDPWSARAAAVWYRAAAEAGHVEAAWRLGRLHEAGLGVPPDDAEARRWFRLAADGGHGEASFAWGRSWMRELGVAWSRDGAEAWPAGVVDELLAAFERAALLGFHEAAPYAASLATARAAGLP